MSPRFLTEQESLDVTSAPETQTCDAIGVQRQVRGWDLGGQGAVPTPLQTRPDWIVCSVHCEAGLLGGTTPREVPGPPREVLGPL